MDPVVYRSELANGEVFGGVYDQSLFFRVDVGPLDYPYDPPRPGDTPTRPAMAFMRESFRDYEEWPDGFDNTGKVYFDNEYVQTPPIHGKFYPFDEYRDAF